MIHNTALFIEAFFPSVTQISRHASGSMLTDHAKPNKPIPVAERSKAMICGSSLGGIAGSNAAERMGVCLMEALRVVR